MIRTVCAAALLVALTGCTDGASSTPTPAGTPTPDAVTSPSTVAPPVVPPAPARDACYRLTPDRLTRPSDDSAPVPCSSRHTARTIFVGRLDTVVRGRRVAVDSAAVRRQLSTTCPRRLAAFVGGSTATRNLSRFNVVWYSPTPEQYDQGARWFRCDVIAFSGTDSLFDLPTKPPGVRAVLDRPRALDTYGLCGTAAPGAEGFERVICARRHAWTAFGTVDLPGGSRYPGVRTVRGAGDGVCKRRAGDRAGDALRFRYGWEWPTRRQWLAGQHFGYCWVPG